MSSISLRDVLRKAASRVGDGEDGVWGELTSAMRGVTKLLLETMAESEVERRVGVGLYERGGFRVDHRNGYRMRTAQLTHDVIEIRIPRLRNQGYVPSFLEPNHRAVKIVEDWVEKAFLAGLSRSEVSRLMESTTGCGPSDGLLGRVQSSLDKRVKEFRERPLSARYRYLFLDAAWAKDIVGIRATRICILTAVGVTWDNRKEILGFERVGMEGESAWRGFLNRLVSRGLRVRDLEMVISDEHHGLLKAAQEVFGDVGYQLCWAHRCRNVRKMVAACDRKEVMVGLRDVYKASNLTEAKTAFRVWCNRWSDRYPGLTKSVADDIGCLLAFYRCPEQHWQYLRTTNPIERTFRELRRQQYGCGAFANRDACHRAVYKVFNWLNQLWKDKDVFQQKRRTNLTIPEAA
jgi:putative transposase